MKKLTTHHKLPIDPYEIFILLLTSLSFLTLIVLSVPYFDSAQQIALTLDLILSILFMLDFLYTLFTVPDKRAYLKWGWLDFLGSLPYLPFLRILRIFRAIRSLRVMQQNKFRKIWQDVKNRPERSTLFGVVLFGLILVSLSSYAILQIEILSPDSNIHTASDAIWWAMVTITTVGYGDFFPTTNGGRVVATILMLVGIGFFSAVTSYLSTTFISRGNRTTQKQNEDVITRLAVVEEQLRVLTEIFQDGSKDDE